jgi:hypothetical protein
VPLFSSSWNCFSVENRLVTTRTTNDFLRSERHSKKLSIELILYDKNFFMRVQKIVFDLIYWSILFLSNIQISLIRFNQLFIKMYFNSKQISLTLVNRPNKSQIYISRNKEFDKYATNSSQKYKQNVQYLFLFYSKV